MTTAKGMTATKGMTERIEIGIRVETLSRGDPASTPRISVIIPLAPEEKVPEGLLDALPRGVEILIARGGTRAGSMNKAAAQASGDFLWFLHADTELPKKASAQLVEALQRDGEGLHYFDLGFDSGGAMHVTALGVWFRSRFLGMPFGDQAFCLPAKTFHALGGYDETIPSGEDHRLVWRARQSGLPLRPVKARIITSARKYRQRGWLRTTSHHLGLTFRQAWPEFVIWLRRSRGRSG
jgi:hypothetical protein